MYDFSSRQLATGLLEDNAALHRRPARTSMRMFFPQIINSKLRHISQEWDLYEFCLSQMKLCPVRLNV
jgi:hypothetical protein